MKTFTTLALFVCFALVNFASFAQSTVFYTDFENGLPAGWTQSSLASDGGWKFGTNTYVNSPGFPVLPHTNVACTNDDVCTNCNKSADYLMTPTLDLTGYSDLYLSFYYFFNKTSGEKLDIEASVDNGANWTLVKSVSSVTGWGMANIDMSDYDGLSNVMIAFHYNDGGGNKEGAAIDDVSLYEVASVDASVYSVLVGKTNPVPSFVGYPEYLAGYDLTPKIKVVNTGNTTINSFDVSWTDGVNTYNHTVTGVNITHNNTYTYASADLYHTLAGDVPVTATISNINGGGGDYYSTYNTLYYHVNGITPNPDKKYLAEEATGTWCGWCVRGIVFMDYMREEFPDLFVGVAVHNGDPMTVSSYDNGIGSYIAGYPSVVVDRTDVIDPSELEQSFLSRIDDAPAARVTLWPVLNQYTNKLSIQITGDFLQNLSGDYRFAAVIVEDSVHGTASGYKQANYYAGGSYGPMGGFEDLSGNIAAAQMYYDFVGTSLLGGFSGQSGSLPATINAGDSHSYTFNYTVPSTTNINHMHVVGLILNNDNDQVVNANQANWTLQVGVDEVPANASIFLYPNPTSDVAYLDIKILNPSDVEIEITNALGQIVSMLNYPSMSSDQIIPLNIKNFMAGIYSVKVKCGEQEVTRRLVIAN